MPNEVKLLPCPFCGGEAAYTRERKSIGCTSCWAEGPVTTSEGIAIEWNTRPTTVVTDEVVERLSCERVTLNDRIKQLRAERKLYFDCEGDGVDVLLIDIQDHFDRAASMPTVVTGEQPEDLGDHALPCSASSPVPRSRPKAAAAIAKGGA